MTIEVQCRFGGLFFFITDVQFVCLSFLRGQVMEVLILFRGNIWRGEEGEGVGGWVGVIYSRSIKFKETSYATPICIDMYLVYF